MVAPIRVAGWKGRNLTPNPDPLAGVGRQEAGTKITYTSPRGEVWGLHYPTVAESEVQRVVMAPGGMDGASVTPEFSEVESVSSFGVRRKARRFKPFEVTMGFTVTSDVQPLEFQEQDWRGAWSFYQPGRITVVNRAAQNRWCRAVLGSMADLDTELKGRRYFESEMTWICLDGIWFGHVRTFTGNVTVTVPGDEAPSMRLRWDGQATTFTTPDLLTVKLPELSGGERLINLDYGYSGQVTFAESGAEDTVAWSALQGILGGITLTPHVSSNWKLGAGLTLEVTPRYWSPWR